MKTEQRDLKVLALNTGVMWSQGKEFQQTPEARRGKDSPLELPERVQPCQHPDFSPMIKILDSWPPEL